MSKIKSSLRGITKSKSIAPAEKFALCATTDTIITSSKYIEELQNQYIDSVQARRDAKQIKCNRSAEEVEQLMKDDAIAEEEEEKADSIILGLHTRLRATLGDKNYYRMLQSRASVFKSKPRLPAHMGDLDDEILIELIKHPGEEGAEGPAGEKKASNKVLGGGGHSDKTPTADEIGSG